MRVIGLDLSLTSPGVALADGSTVTLSAKNLKGARRLVHLRDAVGEAFAADGMPDLVCIEGYSYNSRNGGERLGELGGVVRTALYEQGIAYVEVAPSAIKTLSTGKGNSAKEEVFAAAIRRLSYKGNSLDEADALWAREFALQHFGDPTVDLPQNHLRSLNDFEWPDIPGLAESMARHPAGGS